MTAQPEAPSTDAPSAEDRTQLRIGLVMTGGVSLCVWMGGVAYELDRLRRLDDPTYRALADFAGVEPVIDVIGGTSAGGLNGVLLASGIAWDSTIESLRDLWLTLADFSELLRSPDEAKPPSLLKGDAYFLKGVQRALEAIEASKALNPARVHAAEGPRHHHDNVARGRDAFPRGCNRCDGGRDDQSRSLPLRRGPRRLRRRCRSGCDRPPGAGRSFERFVSGGVRTQLCERRDRGCRRGRHGVGRRLHRQPVRPRRRTHGQRTHRSGAECDRRAAQQWPGPTRGHACDAVRRSRLL